MNIDLNPFEFGTVVTGKSFTDRQKETERLIRNFTNGTNTILISPRRWGKSSLVKEVARRMPVNHPNVKFCIVDLFNIRSEHEFYEKLLTGIVNSTSGAMDDAKRLLRNTFKMFIPKLSASVGPVDELAVSLEWNEAKKNADEILDFAEHVAARKKIKLIVCIDEFQNLEFFKDNMAFQKKLRAHWQHHKHVTYCLYGSKRHMMLHLFSKTSMPFYRFGDMMILDRIDTAHFEKFISDNFKKTGKIITIEQCRYVIEIMKNHPYYVQQLAHILWNISDKKITNADMEVAIEDLLNQNTIFYQREADNLSNTQIGLLKAIISGATALSSVDSMNEFGLGTSANVKKNKMALEKKEILDLYSGVPGILDPGFELWIKRNFMS